MQASIRVEKPRLVELVEGLGVYVPARKLLSAVRASKKSPSALLRQLMQILFTEEEMATCSVRRRGDRTCLSQQQMEAALGMHHMTIPICEFFLDIVCNASLWM